MPLRVKMVEGSVEKKYGFDIINRIHDRVTMLHAKRCNLHRDFKRPNVVSDQDANQNI